MLNNISIMGRFTKDPDLRYTPAGVAVCNFSLAVERDYKDGNGNRETDFIDCQAWRGAAEMIAKYFTKGRMAAVNGRLQTRTYQAQDGSNRKAFEVVVENIYFADSAKKESSAAPAEDIGTEIMFDDDDLPF